MGRRNHVREKLGAGKKSLTQEESLFGVKPGGKMRLKRG